MMRFVVVPVGLCSAAFLLVAAHYKATDFVPAPDAVWIVVLGIIAGWLAALATVGTVRR